MKTCIGCGLDYSGPYCNYCLSQIAVVNPMTISQHEGREMVKAIRDVQHTVEGFMAQHMPGFNPGELPWTELPNGEMSTELLMTYKEINSNAWDSFRVEVSKIKRVACNAYNSLGQGADVLRITVSRDTSESERLGEVLAARAKLSGELAGIDPNGPLVDDTTLSDLAQHGATPTNFKRYGQKRRPSDAMAWNPNYDWKEQR